MTVKREKDRLIVDIHGMRVSDAQFRLESLIASLTPEKTRENCAAIREYFGYYETGRATDAACDYIIERLGRRGR